MLNNITNFFNLIKSGMTKTQLESSDLLPIGTRDRRYGGNYKPATIKYSDLVAGLVGGSNGQVLFNDSDTIAGASNLYWDKINQRVGIGTSSPLVSLDVRTSDNSPITPLSTVPNTATTFLVGNTGTNGVLSLGQNNTGQGWIQGRSRLGDGSSFPILLNPLGGNILIGTTTDAGFRLDVNGTARVQGNTTVSLNQNAPTRISITNTTSGNAAGSELLLSSNSSALFALGKVSSSYTLYKIIAAGDGYALNTTNGDISILNDVVSGRVKFATGGVSTAQMTLFSTGNLGINTTTDAGFKLDVNGTARVQGPTGYSMVYDSNGILNLNGTYSRLDLFNAGGSLRVRLNNDGPNGTLTLYQNATGYIFLNGAQSGNNSYIATALSIGNQSAANASSILELTSTTKGFLPPRQTQAQRTAIASPAVGLIVYQTDLVEGLYIYKSTGWTFVI